MNALHPYWNFLIDFAVSEKLPAVKLGQKPTPIPKPTQSYHTILNWLKHNTSTQPKNTTKPPIKDASKDTLKPHPLMNLIESADYALNQVPVYIKTTEKWINAQKENPYFLPQLAFLLFFVYVVWKRLSPTPVKLQFHPNPVKVTRRDRKTGKLESTPIDELVRAKCPNLSLPYYPHPFLHSGHAQTIYSGFLDHIYQPRLNMDREAVPMNDGGIVMLDWHFSAKRSPKAIEKVPYVLILHGLMGGSNNSYVQDLVAELSFRGYSSVVMIFRGCSKTPLKNPHVYSASYTGDLSHCINHIRERIPNAALFGIGFSLGANVLTNYVAETGPDCPLVGMISIANPFDFLQVSYHNMSNWMCRNFYSPAICYNIVKHLKPHAYLFRNVKNMKSINWMNAKNMNEFDREFTTKLFNFSSPNEYYRHASSAQHIPQLAIPTLILCSKDDPITGPFVIPYAESLANPNVVLAATEKGGHIGWFEWSWCSVLPIRRWYVKPTAQFVQAIIDVSNFHLYLPFFCNNSEWI